MKAQDFVFRNRRGRGGFTLIELSIALVIIALLVGGILVGKDLIEASRIGKQIAQIQGFTTAINTFKLKYSCIPGDCGNAESLGLGAAASAGANGDGNGQLSYYNVEFSIFWYIQQERLNLWYHLQRAGLIDGTYRGYDTATAPTTDADLIGFNPTPIIGRGMDNGANNTPVITAFGAQGYGNGLALVTMNSAGYERVVTAPEAYSIDSKIDDGLPATGKVQTTRSYSSILASGSGTNGCNVNVTNRYDTAGLWNLYGGPTDAGVVNRIECGLMFVGGW